MGIFRSYLGTSGQKSDFAIRFGHPISCNGNNSSVGIHVRYVLAIYLVRMRRIESIMLRV